MCNIFSDLLLIPAKVSVSKANAASIVNNIWTGSYTTFINVKDRNDKCSVYGFGLNNYNQLGKNISYLLLI